jgi:long-chain fatty acid transport protein
MTHRAFSIGKVCLTALLFLFLTAGSSYGAGFALIEMSASGMGNAFAGGSASAQDASTAYFNPAGLTRLEGNQVLVAGHVIIPSVKFRNKGSAHLLEGVTGVPLRGGNGGDGGVTKFVPNLYYSNQLSDRLAIGLGINSPFGLTTDYKYNWVGRYHAIKSDLKSININPSVAYRVTDSLSVGAGVSAQYIDAELSNAIDFGTLDAIGALGLPPGALGLIPQMSDGYVELDGDSWGVGFNLGVLYEISEQTRVGAAYRSRIEHTLDGDADFSNVPSALHTAPVFKDGGVEADVTLPDSLSISIFHEINPQWMVMCDFTWTNWQVFDELVVEFDNPNQPDSVTTENWQDSYRYSVGVTYKPTKEWSLRAGTSYDRTAVPNKKYRTPRIPGSDRIWVAGGLGYQLSQAFSFDIGYAHLFINDPEIYKYLKGEDAVRGALRGSYDAHIDIISAQMVWRF